MARHSHVSQTKAAQESSDRPKGKNPSSDRWVMIYMGGRKLAYMGSKFFLITPSMYLQDGQGAEMSMSITGDHRNR